MRKLLVTVAFCTGCSAFGSHTAKTLPAGKTEATLTVLAGTDTHGNEPYVNPVPQIGVRHGLTENVEAGLMFQGNYNEVDLKLRLFAGDHVHFAIAPVFGYGFALDSTGVGTAGVAGLATIDTSASTSLLAGARDGVTYEFDAAKRGEIKAAFVGVELRGKSMFVRPCFEAVSTPDYEIMSLAFQFGGT